MRILMVSHAFPPDSQGGVEVCTAHLALALRRRGHQVHVLHRIAQPRRPEYELCDSEWQGLPVTTINNTFAHAEGFEMIYRNRPIEGAFATLLERLKPDLVHLHHLTCLSTGLVAVTQAHGIPALLTLHDYWMVCQRGQMLQPDLTLCSEPEDAKCSRCLAPYLLPLPRALSRLPGMIARSSSKVVRRAADRARRTAARLYPSRSGRWAIEQVRARTQRVHDVMRRADLLITPSRFHRSQLARFGIEPDRIQVVYNGLNTEPFSGFQHTEANHTRFCFIGTVIPSKGVHVLVEAFSQLEGSGATLDVHGWAPFYDGFPHYLRDLEAKGGPTTRFWGAYENSQVASILSKADAVVVPSLWYETFGVTIQEARAAGVPVIASRLGAMREFVEHGATGLLFEPRSPADLAAQMQRFMSDPDLRARLAKGPAPVRTIDQQATEMEAIYQEFVGRKPRAPRHVYKAQSSVATAPAVPESDA